MFLSLLVSFLKIFSFEIILNSQKGQRNVQGCLCALHAASPQVTMWHNSSATLEAENWDQGSPKSSTHLIHEHKSCSSTLLFPNSLLYRTVKTFYRTTAPQGAGAIFEYYWIKRVKCYPVVISIIYSGWIFWQAYSGPNNSFYVQILSEHLS